MDEVRPKAGAEEDGRTLRAPEQAGAPAAPDAEGAKEAITPSSPSRARDDAPQDQGNRSTDRAGTQQRSDDAAVPAENAVQPRRSSYAWNTGMGEERRTPTPRPSAEPADATEERFLRMRRSDGGLDASRRDSAFPVRTGYRDERIREGNQQLDRRAVPREAPRQQAAPGPIPGGQAGAPGEAVAPAPPAWLAGEPVNAPSESVDTASAMRESWLAAPPSLSTGSLPTTGDPGGRADAPLSDRVTEEGSATETLQQSREMVAARWYALNGFVRSSRLPTLSVAAELPGVSRRAGNGPPTLVVMSLTGGVGKTSLVGTLGRALSSMGERVLLVETAPLGLLPYHFGARASRAGVLRTFSPPPGSKDAPVFIASLEGNESWRDVEPWMTALGGLTEEAEQAQRVLLDLHSNHASLGQQLAAAGATILIPISADLNSVIAVQRTEETFDGALGIDGRPVRPWYVLNQYDASLPLHLDVREVLRQQLGDRLLPFVVRRSPALAEALADGMTVIDYAAGSPVAGDFFGLAAWLRSMSPAISTGLRGTPADER